MRLPLSFAFAAFLFTFTPAQDPKLLIDDPVMKWDVGKNGPMLVVEPERTVAVQEGAGWPAFARKRVTIRGLTAIVPTQMTLVMENPPEGNLTDGLPRPAKVIYLLTKLTPAQMRTISSRGIGREDLTGEARTVFDSLVPSPFAWTRYEVRPDRRISMRVEEPDKGVLSEDDRAKVRLRVQQKVTLYAAPLDRPGTRVSFRTDREADVKGDFGYRRDETMDRQRSEQFGVALRTVVENRLKPSQLAYRDRAFDAKVQVPANATVAEILKKVSAATGKEVLSDLRVSDRRVTYFGTEARAGDLLEALAFAVTGTYRRVQDSYVLTSDLVGMGTRRLRLALWADELTKKTREWQSTLVAALAERNTLNAVQFDANGPLTPPTAVQDRLRDIGDNFETKPFDASELGPDLQAFLKRSIERDPLRRPFDQTQISAGSTLEFGFVLPNGTPLLNETTSLGDARVFGAGIRIQRGSPTMVPARVIPLDDTHRLIAKVVTAAEAKTAAEFAQRRGFGELWLETASPEALRAGMEGGLTVRLALRPWLAAKALAEGDLTLLGDTGPLLAKRAAASGTWLDRIRFNPESRLSADHRLIPGSDAQRAAWSTYGRLAQTPGLAGIVLLEPNPAGYQSLRIGSVAMTREMMEMIAFGYGPSLRLRFLREKGIDPIDVTNSMPALPVDLQQPFFLDYVQGGTNPGILMYDAPPPGMSRARVDWDKFRSDLAEAALADLYPRLANLPLFVPNTRRTFGPHASSPTAPEVRWAVLPELSEVGLPASTLQFFGRGPTVGPVAIDATAIPVKQLEEAFDKWRLGR